MAQFTYEVVKSIAVVSDTGTISTELNMIRYSGGAPKYDLRRWSTASGEKRMQKGITMTAEELTELKRILNEMTEI